MKKKMAAALCILALVFELTGCGPSAEDGSTADAFFKSYGDAVLSMDNEYFKTKVLTYDDAGGYVIENELTGEKFLVITGVYGVTVTPIQINE